MMLKRRATPPRRPAAPRSSKPPGRGPSGGSGPGKPPGETFRDFIRTLERLDRGASHKQRAPLVSREGAQ